MGAVSIAVALILIITHRNHTQVQMPVDFNSAVAVAATQDDIDVLVPSQVPAGYAMTSARFEPETYGNATDMRWYLGYRTTSNDFISLWQSTVGVTRIVDAALDGGQCAGAVNIAGHAWQRCANVKASDRALATTIDDTTVVVSGTAAWQELETFVGLLKPLAK